MRLTEAELAEGRRLLAALNERGMSYPKFMQAAEKLNIWLYNHADALLADREEIAREAVREFAEAAYKKLKTIADESKELGLADARGHFCWAMLEIKELAAARGVALREKP